MAIFFFYILRIHLHQVLLLNRWLIWSIPYTKEHEHNLKNHIRIKSYGRISPQIDHIYGEAICCLIKRSEQGILIIFPLAYAKKIAENLILKIIKEEARQRLKETLVYDFSEIEHHLVGFLGENYFDQQDDLFCTVLEAFQIKYPNQHQLIVWKFLENKNLREISVCLYGTSIGANYTRTRQQVKRATDKFIRFGKDFFNSDY